MSIFPILVLLAMSIPIQSMAAEKWEFIIAPYALIPSIDGDTSVGRVEGIDIDVGPDDIHAVFHNVLRHRLILSYEAEAEGISSNSVLDRILQLVPVP